MAFDRLIFYSIVTVHKLYENIHAVLYLYIGKKLSRTLTNFNKSEVVGLHPTTKSNLRTALGVEICKLCIIARICKPLSGKFSDLCSEMGICSDMM